MAYHLSFKFNQVSSRVGGWLENFWCTAASWSAANIQAKALFEVLQPVHGEQADCFEWRTTQTPDIPVRGGTRLSGLVASGQSPINTVAATATTNADYPSTALHLNLSSGGGVAPNKRGPTNTAQWLRGIPDNIIDNSGNYTPTGTWVGKMNALLAFLENGSNNITQRIINPNLAHSPITQFFPATGMFTVPAHGIPDGAIRQVRISGLVKPSQANGLVWVQGQDSQTLQLLDWTALTDTESKVGKAWMRRIEYTYPVITEASIIRSTSHYTGRPTNSLGGRRRRRRKVSA